MMKNLHRIEGREHRGNYRIKNEGSGTKLHGGLMRSVYIRSIRVPRNAAFYADSKSEDKIE